MDEFEEDEDGVLHITLAKSAVRKFAEGKDFEQIIYILQFLDFKRNGTFLLEDLEFLRHVLSTEQAPVQNDFLLNSGLTMESLSEQGKCTGEDSEVVNGENCLSLFTLFKNVY